jgi:hypothetical protein
MYALISLTCFSDSKYQNTGETNEDKYVFTEQTGDKTSHYFNTLDNLFQGKSTVLKSPHDTARAYLRRHIL